MADTLSRRRAGARKIELYRRARELNFVTHASHSSRAKSRQSTGVACWNLVPRSGAHSGIVPDPPWRSTRLARPLLRPTLDVLTALIQPPRVLHVNPHTVNVAAPATFAYGGRRKKEWSSEI